jgi:hypothetical protein
MSNSSKGVKRPEIPKHSRFATRRGILRCIYLGCLHLFSELWSVRSLYVLGTKKSLSFIRGNRWTYLAFPCNQHPSPTWQVQLAYYITSVF